jgi:hypothetical protein
MANIHIFRRRVIIKSIRIFVKTKSRYKVVGIAVEEFTGPVITAGHDQPVVIGYIKDPLGSIYPGHLIERLGVLYVDDLDSIVAGYRQEEAVPFKVYGKVAQPPVHILKRDLPNKFKLRRFLRVCVSR